MPHTHTSLTSRTHTIANNGQGWLSFSPCAAPALSFSLSLAGLAHSDPDISLLCDHRSPAVPSLSGDMWPFSDDSKRLHHHPFHQLRADRCCLLISKGTYEKQDLFYTFPNDKNCMYCTVWSLCSSTSKFSSCSLIPQKKHWTHLLTQHSRRFIKFRTFPPDAETAACSTNSQVEPTHKVAGGSNAAATKCNNFYLK